MFQNIGKKVTTLASVICWVGIIGSVIMGIILLASRQVLPGILTILLGSFVSWLSCLALYAIGYCANGVDEIKQYLRQNGGSGL